ncbi:hypothetical protein Tsubulata_026006 [Turnera subulata]|uniref:Elongator complex protein 6 n=1 Tax=Turnera subulata TaxID=218843 RepID=A0A9Q0FID3_9ROSI|nr:hypothetical protein Tsubulata_026006 [Turnera subulata]
MDQRSSNLLEEAIGLDNHHRHQAEDAAAAAEWPLSLKVVLIEDSVETSGSFVLHHLIKRALSPQSSNVIIFLAFSQPFSHYDRLLRKLGCNLAAQRDSGRFFFFDMLQLQSPGRNEGKTSDGGFCELYRRIQKTIASLPEKYKKQVTVMIDDVSLMEVAAFGSSQHVLDFLRYCHTLTSEFGCSFVALNHEDIYSSMESPTFLLELEYLADVLIKAEPLATGLAADVHGQLTVLNRGICNPTGSFVSKIRNFHFRVKENTVDYFYPGSRT